MYHEKLIFAAFAFTGYVLLSAQQNSNFKCKIKAYLDPCGEYCPKVVNLDYVTKDDYANGVSSVNADHLNIYSTGGFQIKVKSTNAALQNGAKNIQANTMQIKATAGSEPVTGAQYAQNTQLSANETTSVTSAIAGLDKKISIEYKGAGSNTYLDNYISGQTLTIG